MAERSWHRSSSLCQPWGKEGNPIVSESPVQIISFCFHIAFSHYAYSHLTQQWMPTVFVAKHWGWRNTQRGRREIASFRSLQSVSGDKTHVPHRTEKEPAGGIGRGCSWEEGTRCDNCSRISEGLWCLKRSRRCTVRALRSPNGMKACIIRESDVRST